MFFKEKKVVIISQQSWGIMMLSKHHYAVALAKQGATVYFLEGPDQENKLKKGSIKIFDSEYNNLFIIKHRLNFPYNLKFHSNFIYQQLLQLHLKKVEKKIGNIDIVWSFDISNTIPIYLFSNSSYKIFMPVDEPYGKISILAAKNANIIFSITKEILEKYKHLNIPSYFINHSVQEVFVEKISILSNKNEEIRVALSGNFFRPEIDWQTIHIITKNNPQIQFYFYGSYKKNDSNISLQAINNCYFEQIQTFSNCFFEGVKTTDELVEAYYQIDVFLICYDIEKDQSKGTNYHKIMEFLATGKVVISNNVTTYKNKPDLVCMPSERNNENLATLFANVISNLAYYNSTEMQTKRIEFAKENTYNNQLQKIEQYILTNA